MALIHSCEVKHTWKFDHFVSSESTYVAFRLPFGAVDCPSKTAGHVEVGVVSPEKGGVEGVVSTEKGGVEGVERRSGGQRLRNDTTSLRETTPEKQRHGQFWSSQQ